MEYEGVKVIAPVVPGSTEDTFPVAYTNHIQGGSHSYATLAERDAIPMDRRRVGMTCYVESVAGSFQLKGGIENSNWKSQGSGSDGYVIMQLASETTHYFMFPFKILISVATQLNVTGDIKRGYRDPVTGGIALETNFDAPLTVEPNVPFYVKAASTKPDGLLVLKIETLNDIDSADGDFISQFETYNTLGTDWQAVMTDDDKLLGTGSYAVYVHVYKPNSAIVDAVYTGLMSWFQGTPYQAGTSEIPLSYAGLSDGGARMQLRIRTALGRIYLEMKGASAAPQGFNYSFKFRKLI